MTEKSEPADAEVLVECSALPPILRINLQAFLEREPEVRQVTRKLHVTEALLSPDTRGLVAPRFGLVVHLTGQPQTTTAQTADDRGARESSRKSLNGPRPTALADRNSCAMGLLPAATVEIRHLTQNPAGE
jgi:hypothetical protein